MNRVWRLPLALLLTLLCLAGAASPAAAQESFRWRFDVGDEFSLVAVQYGRTEVEEDGFDETREEAYFHCEVVEKETEEYGDYFVIRLTLERVVAGIDGTNNYMAYSYDSADAASNEGDFEEFAEIFDPLIGQQLLLEIDSLGGVYSVDPTDDSAELFELADSEGPYSESGLYRLLSSYLIEFPEEPLSEGDSWKTRYRPLPMAERTGLELQYTYRGSQEFGQGEAELFELSLVPGEEADEADAEEEGIQWISDGGTGQILFDAQQGRVRQVSFEHVQEFEIITSDDPIPVTNTSRLAITFSPLEEE